MKPDKDYIEISKTPKREVRQYSFVLNNAEYTEKKIATKLRFDTSTELNLWLSETGNVIGLDFIQIIDEDKKNE